MNMFWRIFIALSIIPQIILLKILAHYPGFVEQFYSNGLYVYISKLMRYAFGWLPISVGDIFYTGIIIFIIRWLIVNRKRIVKDTKHYILDVLSAVSIAYLAFHVLWAFNYYRLPLHDYLNINKDYSTAQLLDLTDKLTNKANQLQYQLTQDDSFKVIMPYTKPELLKMVPEGYDELAKEFPHLSYQPRSIKPSMYSLPLTYMGFSGYLNPFTNEAQIDYLIPSYKYPTTGSHEVAHQLGYAAENEANFIGSMAAMQHPNPYFNYSGYAFALRHCLHELYLRDPATYEEKISKVNVGVLKNYQEMQDFWSSYENPTEPLFKSTYNNFLKANNQADGMASYNYVVALMVNYYEAHPFE